MLPFTTGIILLIVRLTFETLADSRDKGQYGAAEMTSWVRRQPTTEGGSNPFYQAGVADGPSRTSWMGWDSLDDGNMCLDKEKSSVVKRRGWGKRMVSGGGQQRSSTEREEGMEVTGVDGGGWKKQQIESASICDYWENETKIRIYNAVRAIRTREHVCNREKNDDST